MVSTPLKNISQLWWLFPTRLLTSHYWPSLTTNIHHYHSYVSLPEGKYQYINLWYHVPCSNTLLLIHPIPYQCQYHLNHHFSPEISRSLAEEPLKAGLLHRADHGVVNHGVQRPVPRKTGAWDPETMGKQWENHGKTIGKCWFNQPKMWMSSDLCVIYDSWVGENNSKVTFRLMGNISIARFGCKPSYH